MEFQLFSLSDSKLQMKLINPSEPYFLKNLVQIFAFVVATEIK